MNENLVFAVGTLTYLSLGLTRKIIARDYMPGSALVEFLFYSFGFLSLFLSFAIPLYCWYKIGFAKTVVVFLFLVGVAWFLEVLVMKEAARIAPVFVLLIGLFQVYGLYTEFSKPRSYNDCILENMQGSTSNIAAIEIRRACRELTRK